MIVMTPKPNYKTPLLAYQDPLGIILCIENKEVFAFIITLLISLISLIIS